MAKIPQIASAEKDTQDIENEILESMPPLYRMAWLGLQDYKKKQGDNVTVARAQTITDLLPPNGEVTAEIPNTEYMIVHRAYFQAIMEINQEALKIASNGMKSMTREELVFYIQRNPNAIDELPPMMRAFAKYLLTEEQPKGKKGGQTRWPQKNH